MAGDPESEGFEFPVDRSSILLFASALGETNPIYHDAEYAQGTPLGGVIAPPTFPIASAHWDPDYALRGVRRIPPPPAREAPPRAGATGRSAGSGGSKLARALHGEQRFEYHRPIRPGMTLRVRSRPGRSWQRQGRRGGAMLLSEVVTEYRDEAGDLVATATSVGIITEKAAE